MAPARHVRGAAAPTLAFPLLFCLFFGVIMGTGGASLAVPARFAGRLGEAAEVAMENVRRLRAAGVRLIAGTDSPNPGTGAGISMHGELRPLARAGMGSAEALAAATSVAADAL